MIPRLFAILTLLPADDFFQARLARPFLAFAREHRLFVQWCHWHWYRFATWDKALEQLVETLMTIEE